MAQSSQQHSTHTRQPTVTSVSALDQSGSNKNEMGKARKASKKRQVARVSKDMYQIVTDRVIVALENGVKPWACPWDRTNECLMLPQSTYSGINILLLWSETVEQGFSSPYWLTYKQALELGG
ncbi:DNA primase TraC (plasmid) [Vibrio parahaemolyticus]|nr:DNA primase TraC [Vibrio parahaemolyticus]